MKFIVTLFLSTLSFGLTYGQTLKTYTGSYAGGQATYQYFENTEYERIFNGKFSYTDIKDNVNLSRVHMPSNIEIIGAFKDNLKNGLWTAKEIISSVVPTYGNVKITMTYSGNFLNGKRQGQWTFKQSLVTSKKIENGNSVLNFNNNILIGAVDLTNAKGNLDNKGDFIGVWNAKNEGSEFIAEFKNNIFTKLIKRKVSDGEIIFRYDNLNITNQFLDSLKTSQKLVMMNGKRYTSVNCLNLNSYNNDNIEYNEDNKFFAEFYEVISKQVNGFDRTLKAIELGSSQYEISAPLIIVEFNGSTKEEVEEEQTKLIEEEKIKTKNEKEQAEKQRLENEKRKEEQRLRDIELTKIREFENTDYGRLTKDIKKKFEIWQIKSDFETTTDFEARLKNESSTKLKSIVDEYVSISQRRYLNKKPGSLQNYNADEQSFDILVRKYNYSEASKYDTLKVFINKELAQQFYERFNYNRDDENAIIIVPQVMTMINNNWKITTALIVLDNFWTPRGVPMKQDYKILGSNGTYSGEYDHYGLQKYKLSNIKSQQKNSSLDRAVFFYEWKSPTEPTSQKLDFVELSTSSKQP